MTHYILSQLKKSQFNQFQFYTTKNESNNNPTQFKTVRNNNNSAETAQS